MTRRLITLAALALLLPLLPACGDDGETADEAATSSSSSTTTGSDAPGEETTTGEDGFGSASVGDVTVTDAWARSSPMNATRGAMYLHATSTDGDRLVAASVSPEIAGRVELHETVPAEDGASAEDTGGGMGQGEGHGQGGGPMMTMRQVDAIELPAGTTVMLAPGGLHIMFVDLVQPLAEGTDVDVTLRFEKAGETTMSVPVRTQ